MDFTSIRFIMHAIMPMSFSTLKSIMPPSSCNGNIHNSDSLSYTPFLTDKPKTTARHCLLNKFTHLSTIKYINLLDYCQEGTFPLLQSRYFYCDFVEIGIVRNNFRVIKKIFSKGVVYFSIFRVDYNAWRNVLDIQFSILKPTKFS